MISKNDYCRTLEEILTDIKQVRASMAKPQRVSMNTGQTQMDVQQSSVALQRALTELKAELEECYPIAYNKLFAVNKTIRFIGRRRGWGYGGLVD